MNEILYWILLGILIIDVISNGILIIYRRQEKSLRNQIQIEIKEILKGIGNEKDKT